MSNAATARRRNARATYLTGVIAFGLICWPVAAWLLLTGMGF